ncbi:MAG TPA: sulfate ABC transporter ATP-binding protein [Tepidisphaeraceae bacterium]|nr:sulfate ABC transporter ATP-binding protein [Tepidisphaeraceae bacterium]
MSISVHNVSKSFGSFQALNDVSLTVETGELVALLGPSGSGKTTLLRIIAGLEQADPGGEVRFFGENVADEHVSARKVGFVFQHYALFKHMTVLENVAFGLRAKPWRDRPGRREIKDRVMELLKMVQLDGFAHRFPSQLSGGQRQRVALARALAVRPKVLLLDEPFGALDAKVRRELRRWLRKLHDDVGITSVFVTHDQEEALEVSDRVAVMSKGKIEQVGTPEEVYDNPANPFVYNFLGNVNLFHARVDEGDVRLSTGAGGPAAQNGKVAYVRPHDVEIFRDAPATDGVIGATVEHVGFAGSVVNVSLKRQDTAEVVDAEITRDRYRELALRPAEQVYVRVRNARVFEGEDYSI